MIKSFHAVTGENAQVKAHTAGTDAPNLGFPTIVFGPGSCEQAHSQCEYVAIAELEIATKVYLHAVVNMLA